MQLMVEKRLEKEYVIKYVKKIMVNQFKWIEDTCPFNEDFTKSYNEESDEGYFLKVDIQYPEKLHELDKNLPCLLERMKLKKSKSFLLIYMIKMNM